MPSSASLLFPKKTNKRQRFPQRPQQPREGVFSFLPLPFCGHVSAWLPVVRVVLVLGCYGQGS